MKQLIYTICLLLLSTFMCNANVYLPSVFSDNMVLQRNSDVAIWGWAAPGHTVKIVGSWNNTDTIEARANNQAFWTATIKTKDAGGPHTLTIVGKKEKVLKNVMFGEVWVCSGQSNMEWSVDLKIKDGEQEAAQAKYSNIRFFHVPKIGSDSPQNNCIASWQECTPETMRATSAISYFFGRELHKNLDVPVGLIVSAWGGTNAEVWVRDSVINANPVLKESAKFIKTLDWWPFKTAQCYNAMINPIIPYGIAGAIWYQGESNSNAAHNKSYDLLMRSLIDDWRLQFKKDIPFYFVQIAPFKYGNKQDQAYIIREQQTKTAELKNTGMIVIWDLTDDVTNIHPMDKTSAGKRLANMALAETYKKPAGPYKSPLYESMDIEQGKIRVAFKNPTNGLKCSDKILTGFEIAGNDKVFVKANAKIEGKTVIVSSPKVKYPVAVRFMFDNYSIGNLYSADGMPVAPFRTDNFEQTVQ